MVRNEVNGHVKRFCIASLTIGSGISVFLSLAKRFSYSDLFALAASIQDDSFYYIVPAHAFAHTGKFSLDGVTETYGFQPLYEMCLVLLSYMELDLPTLLRISLLLNAGCFLLGAGFTAFSCRNVLIFMGRTHSLGWVTAATFLFVTSNTWLIFAYTTAKENALAFMIFSAMVYLLTSSHRDDPWYVPGLALGSSALLLTRLLPDTLMLATICAYMAWTDRRAMVFIIIFAVPLVGWASFAYQHFGFVVPASAQVKAAVNPFLPSDITVKILEYLHAVFKFSVFGPSQILLPQPDVDKAARPYYIYYSASLVFSIGVASLILKALQATRAHGLLWAIRSPAGTVFMLLIGTIICSVITGYALLTRRPMELFYTSWYVFSLPSMVALACGCGMGAMLHRLPLLMTGGPEKRRFAGNVLGFSLVLVLASTTFQSASHIQPLKMFAPSPDRWQDAMIRSALHLRRRIGLAPNDLVAAWNAGALSFVLHGRVMNMDGLANNEAARTFLAGGNVFELLQKYRPRFVVDIKLVEDMVLASGVAEVKEIARIPFPSWGDYRILELDYRNR